VAQIRPFQFSSSGPCLSQSGIAAHSPVTTNSCIFTLFTEYGVPYSLPPPPLSNTPHPVSCLSIIARCGPSEAWHLLLLLLHILHLLQVLTLHTLQILTLHTLQILTLSPPPQPPQPLHQFSFANCTALLLPLANNANPSPNR
jgi:hypothetical protein